VVARGGIVTVDPSAVLDGRGAWVHPTRECVDASIKRKAFGRALRSNVALDTEQLLAIGGASTEAHKEQAD
jgi:predicted RNA-binding protein YlxR (DUF448 family)